MTSLDFGLFGLDALGGLDKDHGMDDGTVTEFQDILNMSLDGNVIGMENDNKDDAKITSWEDDTDEFLQSMLTGSDISPESQLGLGSETVLGAETVLSDASSDSGIVEDKRMLMSPGLEDGPRLLSPGLDSPLPQSPENNLDIIDYISNDSDTGESMLSMNPIRGMDPLKVAMAPVLASTVEPILTSTVAEPVIRTSNVSLDPVVSTTTGTTTIILPAIGANHQTIGPGVTFSSHRLAPRDPGPAAKRRRVSASSSDSGMEDNKYPRLELNEEELRMAAKEGMTFPKYYPLTREEERNLKKIRRKIRNKLSAQDSRKRKREYLDSMEDRVKLCSDENQQLKDKIKALESQNKTLAAQLRRIHQIMVNGGFRQGQTSTALMVLLLSTALFLIPGVREQTESKSEIDIQAAVKMPPMPGQSRSLLQFDPPLERNTDIADLADFEEEVKTEPGMKETNEAGEGMSLLGSSPRHMDHDYTAIYTPGIKMEPGKAWIDEDAPPMGYGSALKSMDEDRHMNVNVSSSGQGTRTVVLQIPKDIQ